MTDTKLLRLAAATANQTPIDWKNNLENIALAIEEAKYNQVDFLLFPELCLCGYGCEDLFLSDWIWEKSILKLKEIARLTAGITVSVGLPVKYNGKLYNCASLVSNGQILGFSAKQHLANDGVHYEHRWFEPWPANKTESFIFDKQIYPIGDLIYEIDGIKIAFEICEDMWHQESRPAERYAAKGVHIIMNPSASPFTFGKTKRRESIVSNSARDYNCVYLYANLLGNESGRIIFDGELFIAAEGKISAQNKRFSFKKYNLLFQDFSLINDKLVLKSAPSIAQVEIKETEFYKAASLGLFDYLRKSKSKCYVLSLSGGADSIICAVLVRTMIDLGTEELGPDNFLHTVLNGETLWDTDLSAVNSKANTNNSQLAARLLHCAYQATENSSEDTFNSARDVAEELGATFYNWTIDDALEIYTEKIEKAVRRQLTWEKDDVSLQNIQARVRAPFIWFLANLKNGLLLTTSNRSEGDVGYCTMDGDTAGGLAPIAGVDKVFVQQWLIWAEKELGLQSLKHVNRLKPSAELRPSADKQTDEADLMPYSLLLEIEKLAIFEKLSPEKVFQAIISKGVYPKDELKTNLIKFYRLWQRNQWKRERLAPGFHLDEFNVDPKTWYRFPILGGGFEEELMNL